MLNIRTTLSVPQVVAEWIMQKEAGLEWLRERKTRVEVCRFALRCARLLRACVPARVHGGDF